MKQSTPNLYSIKVSYFFIRNLKMKTLFHDIRVFLFLNAVPLGFVCLR